MLLFSATHVLHFQNSTIVEALYLEAEGLQVPPRTAERHIPLCGLQNQSMIMHYSGGMIATVVHNTLARQWRINKVHGVMKLPSNLVVVWALLRPFCHGAPPSAFDFTALYPGNESPSLKKKKKKLHHSSHIRLIRWTLPVSRDIGEHNEQAESTTVCSVQVGHKPGVRVTSSGHSAKQPPGRAQVEVDSWDFRPSR